MANRTQSFTLIAVLIASFLTPFTGSAINIAIPAIGKDMGANVVFLTWLSTAFLLASSAFLLPIGRLADIRGKRTVFAVGIMIFGLTSLGCGIAPTPQILLAMRVLQGIGGACVFGTGMAMLSSTFPPGMRGQILGINAAIVYIGISVGPVLGGIITHSLSWRYIFFISFILCLVAEAAVSKIKESYLSAENEQFNVKAALLYIIGLTATMYGIAAISTSRLARLCLPSGILLLILFVYYDMRTSRPLLDIRTLSKNRVFAYSNLAALISYLTTSGLGFLVSLYLQVVKGLNPAVAGMVMLAQPAIMAMVSPFSGRISDRAEPQIVATSGMIITSVGLVMFAFCGQNTSLSLVIAALMITGLGFGLFASPNNNAIMSSVEPRQYGVASSTLSTARLVGQTLSMTLVTLIIAAIMGNVKITPSQAPFFMKAMHISMILFSIFTVPGIFASMARGTMHQQTVE